MDNFIWYLTVRKSIR